MNAYTLLTQACWAVLFGYWWLMSRQVKIATYRQSSAARAVYLFFLILGFVLLYVPATHIAVLDYQIFPLSTITGLTGVGICIAGVAFAIWARKTLGNNWSGNVTLKKEHELIQSGPYSLVRHPIYTGFEICFLGAAITTGQLKGFMAILIIFINHLQKIKLEEAIMHQQFPGQYEAYAKRVKRLIPFIY
jgi:protein-S-isoprenylcysteine O-methyltransferase Ste14